MEEGRRGEPTGSAAFAPASPRAFTLREGVGVTIRAIAPDDEPRMAAFHVHLSDRSVYFRYFHPVALGRRVSHERLARICHPDPRRELVLVAERRSGHEDGDIVAVGRLTRSALTAAEFAVVVRDDVQGQGLGTEMLRRLVDAGRAAGLARIAGEILPDNHEMVAVAERVGFRCAYNGLLGVVKAEIAL